MLDSFFKKKKLRKTYLVYILTKYTMIIDGSE